MVGIEYNRSAGRFRLGVGVHGLVFIGMAINQLMGTHCIESGNGVGTDGLPPYCIVPFRPTKQITYLTSSEAQAVHTLFGTDKVFCTRLFVGTQINTVRKDEAVLGGTSYVAHDMPKLPQSVVLTFDCVIVAVTGFDA